MSRRAARCYYYAAIARACEGHHVALYFVCIVHIRRREFDTQALRYRPNSGELSDTCRRR